MLFSKKSTFVAKLLSICLAFGILFATFNTNASVVPFAKRSQRLLYGATSTQFDIEINQDGVSFKYNFSGNNAIAVQNYCGFWLSVCDDTGWLEVTPLAHISQF